VDSVYRSGEVGIVKAIVWSPSSAGILRDAPTAKPSPGTKAFGAPT
jgi:hypothetical protein